MKVLLALFLFVASAVAQSTVTFSSGPGQRDLRDPTGAPITSGVAIIGTPDGIEYGRTPVREIFGLPGRFAGSASSLDPVFDNQNIWLTIVSDQGIGIYTSASWRFPFHDALPPENTLSINTSQVDTAIKGFLTPDHLIVHIPEPDYLWIVVSVLIGAILYHIIKNEV